MVQQISALIVQPVLDPSKYTPGAQEKVAADKAMTASMRETGAAAVDTSAKISTSGDVLSRLSRQYVEGYAVQQRFSQGLGQLNRGLETGKISIEGAERILIGMNQRLGLTANAADLAAKGQMSLAAAVERANVQIARQASDLAAADAANRRMQAANSNVISEGSRRAAGFNAGQQLQDIAMMSLVGQDPRVLALQQGPQLATAIQQGGGLAALGSGLASLLSMTTLLTIGFTAATAATIQWAMKGKDGAKSLDDALKAHSETLRLLKGQYGELGEAVKTVGNSGGLAFTGASARDAQTLLQAQIRTKSEPFLDTLGGVGWMRNLFGNGGGVGGLRNLSGDQRMFAAPMAALIESAKSGKTDLTAFNDEVERLFSGSVGQSDNPARLRATADAVLLLGSNAFEVTGKFAPFSDAINRLKVESADGKPNLSAFNTEIERIGQQKGLRKLADEAILAGKEIVSLADKAAELERVLQRLDREETRPGLADRRALGAYVNRRAADIGTLNAQFDADQQMARARTNAERLAAVEAQVRARARGDGDKGGGLQARVDRALAEERTRQEVEARDATIQRSQALERSLQQQRLELDLIGKTGGEQAKLRFEFERMQELREQAARTGMPIDEKEVATIKAAAEAMKGYADQTARAKWKDDNIFERGQFFRSPLEQQIASRQRGAGLPLDMNSPEAMQMRQLDRMERVYSAGMSFWDDFERGVRSGDDIGKAFVKAFRNAMMEELADVAKTAFSNFLKAGIAAVFPSAGAPSASGGGIVGSLLGGANDNYAPGAVTRAPLPDIGSFASAGVTKTGIPLSSISVQGLGAKVNAAYADRFQGLLNDLTAAGYPITSLGEGGYSFRNVAGSKNLSNHAFGNAIDINPRQNPWAVGAKGNFARYGIDPNELAQKNGLFWGGNWNKSDAMHFQVDKTVKSLDKLSTSSIDTAKSLEGGLGKLGSSLNQYPAAPSGGGAGGLLGSLFGGLNSAFSGSKAFNFLSANPGKFINFYADGTEGAPPGWAWVGERGPELMRMRGGETIRSNQRSMQMTAERANGGGVAAIVPDIRVYVDQDGNWQAKVEEISQGPARQESNRAVGNYAYQQSNGGAKADDHRYQRLKRRA